MARVRLVVKYTFFVIIILGAALVVERLTKIEHWMMSESYVQEDLIYNASAPLRPENFRTVLKKHYLKCLTNPSKSFCLLAANKRLEIFQSNPAGIPNTEVIESRLKNVISDLHPRGLRMYSLLEVFTRFMNTYDIKVLLIEPSVLFCFLSSEKKYKLLTRGYNPSRHQGSRDVVTVGVFVEDSKKLEEVNLKRELLSSGFKIVKIRKWIGDQSEKSFETVHYFFILQDIGVHVVVFYPKSTYLWHAGLDTQEVDLQGLLFLDDGIFEKFTLSPLNLNGTSISRIFLSGGFGYFMREIEASRFVECSANSSNTYPFLEHPSLTMDQLRWRAEISLKELKAILAPQMIVFWLWSKTLLGWFAKCDVLQFSTTLELAVMRTNTQGLEFSELVSDNKYLKVVNNTESDCCLEYKLKCHGLDINIFILHEDENLLWLERKEGQNILKLTYPVFKLCSTDVFGQKIHVPCNTEEILKLEYERNSTDMDSIFPDFRNEMNFSLSNKTGS